MRAPVRAKTARKTWAALEPLHGLVYFSPETVELYGALELDGYHSGYFASRSAALGATSPDVVVATFFNFNPRLVRDALDGVWARTTPEAVLDARMAVIDSALRRALGDMLAAPEVVEAAALARTAAERACEDLAGRPLFAAHAALSWPDELYCVRRSAPTSCRQHSCDDQEEARWERSTSTSSRHSTG